MIEILSTEHLNNYQVLIDKNLMTEFTHTRRDGLASCLRAAADAVERQEVRNLVELSDYYGRLAESG